MTNKTQDLVYLRVKDHSVSAEEFSLYKHEKYDILMTKPQPLSKDLLKYYESEDYISHTDAKRNLFERAYGVVKTYMLNKKRRIVQSYVPKKASVLDIGAGTGSFVKHLSGKNTKWNIKGIEPNQAARNIALNKGIDLDEHTLALKEHSFDAISMWHVLEHVPDLDQQMNELDRLLRKDGTLIIAVPNFKSYDAKTYRSKWAGYDVPRHLWHFSASGIEDFFGDYGFTLITKTPMWFDAFYVSLLSEKYATGKMNLFSASLTGFISNALALKTGEYSSLIYIFRRKTDYKDV